MDNTLQSLDEASISQIPAIIQLVNLGYEYLSREEIRKLRNGDNKQYILRTIAKEALQKINPEISPKSIEDAIVEFENVNLDEGIIKASEHIFTNLLSGISVDEIVDGKKASPQLRFIDFKNPQNNVFNVCCEFEISEFKDKRPDIVVFVNGIPLAVIECKRPSVRVDEAISQIIRNQSGINTPKFFLFPQILLASNAVELKYGTMLTKSEYYSVWKEDCDIHALKNTKISPALLEKITADLNRTNFKLSSESSQNEQAKGIFCLLRPERLLDIIRNYILYDNGVKKITRYQQFFAIKKTLLKIKENTPHKGGLIWHTQGSGKSLTMVMLVKVLTEEFTNPRIIIVTDRRDLDKQISDTFAACNIKKDVTQTSTTAELVKLIKEKSLNVITTLIQKFDRVIDKETFSDPDSNVFILIDEAHRSQGGNANLWMNKILPNACQIAFTGTPLMRSEKDSAGKFGGIIDAYTISEAEKDEAILPLVYQAMYANLKSEPQMLDEFYAQISVPMSDSQRRDFEKKVLSSKVMDENSSRIELIALDIVKHYKAHFQHTGLKGQIVMPSKYTAVICKQAIDLLGGVRAEVIISDTKQEDGLDNLTEQKKLVSDFLAEEKRLHGSLDSREKSIIKDFKDNPYGTELLIVVDKLLTGFDAPRNTVLYLAKQLKDHNLLQAIARVNRLCSGDIGKPQKESGIIIDYSKNAENLKHAMELFSNFDPEDIDHALISTDEKIGELEALYQRIYDVIKNRDFDACLNYFKENEHARTDFYENVNAFIRVFSTCMSLPDFAHKVQSDKLANFCKDLRKFTELKKTTQIFMAEKVDFSKYRDQLLKILNKYVTANEIETLSKEINLSDIREFNSFVNDQKNGMSDRSRAEAIASQTKKIIHERYDEDPLFYGKFSEKIDRLISDLKNAKKEDLAKLLDNAKNIQKNVSDYEDNDIPKSIRTNKAYHPFYRNLKDYISAKDDTIAKIIKLLVEIIEKNKCVDWDKNITVERTVKNEIDDFLYDYVIDELFINLSHEQVSYITEESWNIAVNNKLRL